MPFRRTAATLLLLASCSGVSREARIEAKLAEAGLKPKLAHCLAPKLAHDLSDDQLHELATAMKAEPRGGHGTRMLSRRLSAIDDPRVADIVSRATLACAIMG